MRNMEEKKKIFKFIIAAETEGTKYQQLTLQIHSSSVKHCEGWGRESGR